MSTCDGPSPLRKSSILKVNFLKRTNELNRILKDVNLGNVQI